jgi:membrane-bound lytic murein transglycosylase B
MLVLVLCCPQAQAADRQLTNTEINVLMEIYATEGYEQAYLEKLFRNTHVRYVPNLVRMLVIPPDFTANYKRFTKKTEIDKARAFCRYWRTCLSTTMDTFGVDPGVIAAILLVETSLGKNLGRSPVLSVFASLLLENSLHRDAFAKGLSGNARKDHYLKRLDDKATWARAELQALMVMNQKKSIDVCGLKGSYAGAFGIAQFLPTSYLKWAHSGKETRPPNLFYMPHAIMSVANFLKKHGWQTDLTDKEKRTVIWSYNRSNAYVDTVLVIAGKINPDKGTK